MKLSLLKESIQGENRVALSPDIVKKLVAKGFDISLVSGAGENAYFSDDQYRSAGAEVVT
ncbi:MAG: NAD(P)(+) transhydrogenase (Re/Si-specific) subunit alpha, partial [Candidatus Thiodiazotropha sp. (ex Semelilucina semeliformis)]|nr:NAD(P)(+) transhydrogenase (Re/Si-specific) subunit alpha [Candidatus Thiodiazotropha sp. (ex Semelilucina semeliformis)]